MPKVIYCNPIDYQVFLNMEANTRKRTVPSFSRLKLPEGSPAEFASVGESCSCGNATSIEQVKEIHQLNLGAPGEYFPFVI